MPKKLTKEEFIKRAKEIHGDFYDYSKVEYIDRSTKVTIICPIHGEFEITPSYHLRGFGCNRCIGKRTTEDFIEEAKKVHGDFYDYSNVKYVNSFTKVKIICPIHGEFEQIPSSHLSGSGCFKCAQDNKKLTEEEFIKRAKEVHNDFYDYSKVEYVNNHTKVEIICPNHGSFFQTPSSHLLGIGCRKCGHDSQRLTKEKFIENSKKVHGDFYDYSKVEYVNNFTKVKIICPIHGEFEQIPHHHVKSGCPKCKSSKLEDQTRRLLLESNITFEEQKTWDWLVYDKPQRVDFFLPDFNIIIECQGEQHFKAIDFFGGEEGYKITIERDKNKKSLCESHNLKVVYFSNLGEDYEYPYEVITNIEEFIKGLVL